MHVFVLKILLFFRKKNNNSDQGGANPVHPHYLAQEGGRLGRLQVCPPIKTREQNVQGLFVQHQTTALFFSWSWLRPNFNVFQPKILALKYFLKGLSHENLVGFCYIPINQKQLSRADVAYHKFVILLMGHFTIYKRTSSYVSLSNSRLSGGF